MGFNQDSIVNDEWAVVEAVAKLINKSPHWVSSFKSNIVENNHIIKWDLCDVGLTKLPEIIGNLSELRTFHLGRNKLLELPESIGKLTNLEELTINSDVFLPPSLSNCLKLRNYSTMDKGSSGGASIQGLASVKRTLLEPLQAGCYILRMRRGIALINAKNFALLSIEEKQELIRTKKGEREGW